MISIGQSAARNSWSQESSGFGKAPDQWVLNFPTKQHWRQPSKLEWIEAGLRKFVAEYERRGITEISFPRLGCGNGGLNWTDVRPFMEAVLAELPIPVYVHDFEKAIGPPEHLETTSGAQSAGIGRSFDQFVDVLAAVIVERGGQFRLLASDTPFSVAFVPEKRLRLDVNGQPAFIHIEDLRSIMGEAG